LLEGTDGGGGPHATVIDRLYLRFNVVKRYFEFKQTADEEWMPVDPFREKT
jgi:hypothetical protein